MSPLTWIPPVGLHSPSTIPRAQNYVKSPGCYGGDQYSIEFRTGVNGEFIFPTISIIIPTNVAVHLNPARRSLLSLHHNSCTGLRKKVRAVTSAISIEFRTREVCRCEPPSIYPSPAELYRFPASSHFNFPSPPRFTEYSVWKIRCMYRVGFGNRNLHASG